MKKRRKVEERNGPYGPGLGRLSDGMQAGEGTFRAVRLSASHGFGDMEMRCGVGFFCWPAKNFIRIPNLGKLVTEENKV